MGYTDGATSNLVGRPRYLFLMRHADQREGHLTKDGSAHARYIATRLREWMDSEWRCQSDRTFHLWHTTQATEVQETIDLLTHEVLAQIRRNEPDTNSRFCLPDTQEEPACTHAGNHRQEWMARLLPHRRQPDAAKRSRLVTTMIWNKTCPPTLRTRQRSTACAAGWPPQKSERNKPVEPKLTRRS
jgi:hypothetical protein